MTPRIMAVYIQSPSPMRDPGTRTMSIPGLGGGEFTRSCLVSKGPRALRKADRNRKKVRFVDESRDGYQIATVYEVESYKEIYNPEAKTEVTDVNCKSCRCQIF